MTRRRRSRARPLQLALLGAASCSQALPTVIQPPAHSCSEVEVTHTNLPAKSVSEVLSLYMATVDGVDLRQGQRGAHITEQLARQLSQQLGGFWDIYFLGGTFSYSVYCLSYVSLASSAWNVLLCREALDIDARDCGPSGLINFSNGTLPAHTEAQEGGRLEPRLTFYDHYLDRSGRLRPQHERTVAGVLASFSYGEIDASFAVAVRRKVEGVWPADRWNVIVESLDEREELPAGKYLFSEEHLVLMCGHLQVSIFDRRCYHDFAADGMEDDHWRGYT